MCAADTGLLVLNLDVSIRQAAMLLGGVEEGLS